MHNHEETPADRDYCWTAGVVWFTGEGPSNRIPLPPGNSLQSWAVPGRWNIEVPISIHLLNAAGPPHVLKS